MSTLAVEIVEARAQSIEIDEDRLVVNLTDSRTVSVPLAWYPRPWHGKPEERACFEIIGDGAYIHWPNLDEDLTVAGILAGRRSGESLASLQQWIAARK
jgi:hypothetical protein